MGNLIFPKSLGMAFRNFLTFPWQEQFFKIPIVWLSAVLYIPLFFRRLLRKEAQLTEIGYTLFLFLHTGVFFFMTYRPTRYFIPVIPAMIFLTVLLFERWVSISLSNNNRISLGLLGKTGIFILDFLWLSLAAYFCLIPLFSRYFLTIPRHRLSIYYLIASAVLVGAVYQIKKLYYKYLKNSLNLKYLIVPIVVFMFLISVVVDMRYYCQWYRNRTYHAYDMAKEIGEKLDHAYIAGMTGAIAVLENQHKTLWLYPNFVNWDEHTFDKYPLTHALLGTDISREIFHFFNQWPERMKHAKLLRIYPLKDYFLHLYSFVNPFISKCSGENDNNYQLKIVNPSPEVREIRIGEIYFFENVPGEKSQQPNYRLYSGEKILSLNPGENEAVIPVREIANQGANQVLFFLNYPSPFDDIPLRYEAEHFSGRTGSNRKDSLASNKQVRYYNRKKNPPGYLAYGPSVPYAPGFLIADFHITFNDLSSNIRGLCRLEIVQSEGAIARRIIKPADITSSHSYGIYTLTPGTGELQFRLETEKRADVAFDYVDVTYYQGYIVKLK
jgi:hypothetical protein